MATRKNQSLTKMIAVCAVMTGLAIAFSFVKVFQMPFGGSITLCSMLPIMFVGYAYGAPWGVGCGLIYGAVQALIGASESLAYFTKQPGMFIICLMFDYLVAFAALGLSGVFKKRGRNHTGAFAAGVAFSGALRLLCHFVSGYIVWGGWAEDTMSSWTLFNLGAKLMAKFSGSSLAVVYSLVYNVTYMIPEIILCVIAAVVIIQVKDIKKEVRPAK